MVNVGLNSAALLGIVLAVAGAGLYFLRSIRPELARDQDIFFAAVGLLCGGILITQGWRLDPILQFGQFLLAGTTFFFAYEAIRLRGVATKVVKERTPIVDEERPVSRVYRYEEEAELYDQLEPEPEEDRYISRRLRGTADPRTNTRDRYDGEPRRTKSRGGTERQAPGDRPRKRPTRPTSTRPPERSVDTWDASLDDSGSDWEDREERPTRSSRPRSTRPDSRDLETASRPRRRRPSDARGSTRPTNDEDTIPADYVDYQPIDPAEEETDRAGGSEY